MLQVPLSTYQNCCYVSCINMDYSSWAAQVEEAPSEGSFLSLAPCKD